MISERKLDDGRLVKTINGTIIQANGQCSASLGQEGKHVTQLKYKPKDPKLEDSELIFLGQILGDLEGHSFILTEFYNAEHSEKPYHQYLYDMELGIEFSSSDHSH